MSTYAKIRDTCLRRSLLSDAIVRVDTLSEGRQTRRGWSGGRGEHHGLIYETRGSSEPDAPANSAIFFHSDGPELTPYWAYQPAHVRLGVSSVRCSRARGQNSVRPPRRPPTLSFLPGAALFWLRQRSCAQAASYRREETLGVLCMAL